MSSSTAARRLRIAATGDIHCRDSKREAIVSAFAQLGDDVDLVLVAGDLTSHGRLDEAEILCEAAAATVAPVYAVLGNHDWHADEAAVILERLEAGGIQMLDRRAVVCQVGEVEVGIVGVKGFVGGFAPRHLPDFGEPSLRAVYADVLHAHAHAGSPDGTIGETPVHNVSQPVLGTDFRIFELDASRAHSPIP